MSELKDELKAPETFSFPFPAYDIQNDFMRSLFGVLEKGQLGIFESPTGTGKSLSVICGALTWLQQHNQYYKSELQRKIQECEAASKEDENEDDWFSAATKRREGEEEARGWRKELGKLEKEEERVQQLRERRKVIKRSEVKKMDEEFDELFRDLHDVRESVRRELNQINGTEEDKLNSEENDLVLDEYHSDDDNDDNLKDSQDEEEEQGCLKIIYCSRTHSQLSQFVREVQRSSFSSDIRTVSLASRQNLCVNEAVSRLNNATLINDKCLDLQRGKKGKTSKFELDGTTSKKRKSSSGCPHYRQGGLQALSDRLLLEVQDIEQMVTSGKKSKSCPYYAARHAIRDAQLVVVPYNTLLHEGTRQASGIHLKGNVVIVDEAHNLLETISNIHSVMLSVKQIQGSLSQLLQYRDRYGKRLCAKNLLYINQIIFFINALIKIIKIDVGAKSEDGGVKVMGVGKFLVDTMTDNLNLFKLLQYIDQSKIAHKLHSFTQHFEGSVTIHKRNKSGANPRASSSSSSSSTSAFLARLTAQKSTQNISKENFEPGAEASSKMESTHKKEGGRKEEDEDEEDEVVGGTPLLQVRAFLGALVFGSGKEGRVVMTPGKQIKYLLLDPASHFSQIVAQCRSVVVAGGTMRPVSEFRDQVFRDARERVVTFSCGHVVSAASQLLPLAIPKGPSSYTFDFTYQRRGDPKMMDEVGRVLVNISRVVCGGIVVFLPSYQYEKQLVAHLTASGAFTSIAAKKQIFREPKKSNQLDAVLSKYSKVIRQNQNSTSGMNGALLLCVVGGKMSEGINFSDELGRCVVMIGLPYPNTHSPELKEKMNYLNTYMPKGGNEQAGSVFYKNLCFKAVNQSIGRAIRHRNDYATILLLDHRYTLDSSISALPQWISQHIQKPHNFSQAFGQIVKFFKGRKELTTL